MGRSEEQKRCRTEQKSDGRTFFALLAGGMVSALLAGSCCLGPLLFLLFGVSAGSLSFLQVFAPYRTLFTLLALAVVAGLWVRELRRRDSASCDAKSCRNYRLYLALGTIFVAVMLTYPWWAALLMGGDE